PVLVLVAAVVDVPALNDRKRIAVQSPPLDRRGGPVERTEPDLCRRLPGSSGAAAADRDGFAPIVFAHQHLKTGLARTDPDRRGVDAIAGAGHMAILGCCGGVGAANCLCVCRWNQAGTGA